MNYTTIGLFSGYKKEEVDHINRIAFDYVQALENVDARIIIIPCYTKHLVDYISLCDGFVIPGGVQDINPQLYKQENITCRNINERYDDFMMKALTKIRSQNKKILGICKGLQLINVFCGGTLLQDLPQAEFHNQYTKQYEVVHGIHLHKDSFLEKAFGSDTIQVNSIHHQAVDTLGKGCAIAGYAENDKTIEAIENISYGRYGVQWHPESLAKHQKLFNWFVQQCSSS